MGFFEWKDEYSGGIESIDEQHKKIVAIMDELFEAIKHRKEDQVIKGVFIELLKYANYHFGLEAQLFRKYHYEGESNHIKEHAHFIEKIKTLMINEFLTEHSAALETLLYLRNWFQDHMMKTDMDYCKYFILHDVLGQIDEYLESTREAG